MDKHKRLDRVDLAILRLLQNDSSQSYDKLADKLLTEQIVLDQATVGKKIRLLEAEGYIRGYSVLLNREKLDIDQSTLLLVRLENHRQETIAQFEDALNAGIPNVVESMQASGSWDYLLKIVGSDLKHCSNVAIEIRKIPGVILTREHAVKGEKESPLPLPKPRAAPV